MIRYSPIFEVIEKLYGKGYKIMIYDKNVVLSRLMGQNKSFIVEKLPHISKMLVENIEEVLEFAEVLVITNKEEYYKNIKIDNGIHIIDLVRIKEYEGRFNYT